MQLFLTKNRRAEHEERVTEIPWFQIIFLFFIFLCAVDATLHRSAYPDQHIHKAIDVVDCVSDSHLRCSTGVQFSMNDLTISNNSNIGTIHDKLDTEAIGLH